MPGALIALLSGIGLITTLTLIYQAIDTHLKKYQ